MLVAGASLSGLAVAAGAFGAHGLRDVLNEDQLRWWHTAVEYQFYHGLALLVCIPLHERGWRVTVPSWGFLTGAVVFAGTLYAMALGAPSWFGAITPIGGTAMLVGWIALAVANKTERSGA